MLYSLENEELLVQVRDHGAELRSIKERADETEYLWRGDPSWWKYSAPLLFPIVGKLVDGKYRVGGKTYELPAHGLARISDFELVEQKKDAIRFALGWTDETLQKYPWKFRLDVGYALEGRTIRVTWDVKSEDATEMVFSIGAHPAFRCPIVLGETLEDCYLQFNRKEDAKNMKLAPGVFFAHEREASFTGDKLLLSDAFFAGGVRAYDDLKSDAVTIRSTKSEKTLTISAPGFPYWGFWMPEKGGAPFLCLEPWYGHADYADFDGEFAEKAGTQKLAPGKTFHAEYTITVG